MEQENTAGRRSLIRPRDGLWTAFLVPVVIMIVIFIQRGIFPFGEECYLRTDLYHQYAPFFSEFQHKLRTGGSLLYSWDVGLGVNFSALYAYYLASPFNWLLILCPKAYIIEFMTGLIVLKTGLAGLSFAWYLRKKLKTDSIATGFFGIFYALSGYMAAYSWNIMWLDCIVLFPLIVLGLEQLVHRKRGFLYCAALGMSILSNYYISIMICLFMILYFVALLILEKPGHPKKYLMACVRFGVYSLLAGGLAACLLLPVIHALQATAASDSTFPATASSYFSIIDMVARHIGNVETEIGLDHWPNIYCGVAVLIFFPLYLACKKIPLKEKIVYCGMLLIFYASFSINMLNFIWHGFHYPNSLPCRQSFIYIFIMLYMCFCAFRHLRSTPRKHIAIAFWASVCFVLLAEKVVEQEHFHFIVYYVAILFLAAYTGIIYLWRGKQRGPAVFLALITVSIEAAVNTTVTSVPTTSREAYVRDNADVIRLVESLDDADLYRFEKKSSKTRNDGAWMNFPSVSLFSSTANADLTAFFKRMGCEASTNAYGIPGSTPLVDSMMAVKYALYSEAVPDTELMQYRDESGTTFLYENLYTLPLGFVVPYDLNANWQYEMDSPADVQNDLCLLLGANDVLVQVEGDINGNTLRFTPDMDGEYYVFVRNKRIRDVKASLPAGTKSYSNVDRGYFLEMGNVLAGNEIVLTADESNETLNATVYRFSETAMLSVYDALARMPLVITEKSDTKIRGVVDAAEGGTLFLSIPYDEGWTVTVDGKPADRKKLFDAFLGVNLTEGEHEIALSYYPVGLAHGNMISAASLIILILLYFWRRRSDGKRAAAREEKRRHNTEPGEPIVRDITGEEKTDETLGRKIYEGDESAGPQL